METNPIQERHPKNDGERKIRSIRSIHMAMEQRTEQWGVGLRAYSIQLTRPASSFSSILSCICPVLGWTEGLAAPGAATKLGRVFPEDDEMNAGSLESALTDRKLACWRSMRKREMRIAVTLCDDDIV